jgi:hypothetical protein
LRSPAAAGEQEQASSKAGMKAPEVTSPQPEDIQTKRVHHNAAAGVSQVFVKLLHTIFDSCAF